jgi:hypothetical protein
MKEEKPFKYIVEPAPTDNKELLIWLKDAPDMYLKFNPFVWWNNTGRMFIIYDYNNHTWIEYTSDARQDGVEF